MDNLLTVKEAAKRLRCCDETIRRMAKKGKIPIVKPNNWKIFIRKSDLDAIIEGSFNA